MTCVLSTPTFICYQTFRIHKYHLANNRALKRSRKKHDLKKKNSDDSEVWLLGVKESLIMMMMRSASAASARLRVASASKLATSLRTAIKKVSAVAAPAAATTFGLSSVSSFTTFLGGDVHGTPRGSNRKWKNKPLLRREGDATFKTGKESALMLVDEVKRRDGNDTEFIQAVEAGLLSLGTVFDRSPRTAWMAKQLLEPERSVQFRVAWLDDAGVHRMNRGYRLQWCSALGPYEGSLHFGHHVNASALKSLGFDSVFRNAVTGFNVGGAVGGADFNPLDKSEAEIQRFCQIYMTELVKYIGPDYDVPTLGMGVGKNEIGYMFGQYKRINVRGSAAGKPFLWGGNPTFLESPGFGAVHFAEALLQAHGSSLKGKRCLITGSGMGALSVAQKLLEYGAIPLSFSDSSGFIYEPEGIDQNKINTIAKIKSERGARVGRYIIASTSAQYSDR